MTKEEVAEFKGAIEEMGLLCTKFPKKLEIRIPKVKYPGIYFHIPTDLKSFKLQVYFHQTSIPYYERISTKGYNVAIEDLYRIIYLIEVKGIPSNEELVEYLTEAIETVKTFGIVHMPVVEEVIDEDEESKEA